MALTRYLLELPRVEGDRASPVDLVTASRQAAADLRAAGTHVRVIRSLYVPEDDVWYLLVEGRSAEAAAAVGRAAGWDPRSVQAAVRIERDAPSPDGHGPADTEGLHLAER